MTRTAPSRPQADGLYDPRYEHDACGVGFVARLDNVASARGRRAGRSRRSRTSSTAAPPAPTRTRATAPGSCCRCRDRFLRGRASTSSCRRPAQYGVGDVLPAARRRAPARSSRQLLELNARVEGQRVLGWRDVPIDEAHVGTHRERLAAGDPPALRRRRRRLHRRPGRVRAQALRHPPHRASSARRARELLRRVVLVAHDRLQGHARSPTSCAASTPTCATSARERAGARALALLDEHVPELGAARTRTA